jgi:hypothetical protein
MAIQTAPVRRTDVPAPCAPGSPGLFGTGPAQPAEFGIMPLARGLAVGMAVGVLGVEPVHAPQQAVAGGPAQPQRGLTRRLAGWGAGPDGAHLAWRRTPLRVHRLGGGPARSATATAPAPVRPLPAAAVAPRPVDAELEAAIEFATDFSVDLLRTPARLAAPAPRLTAPVRALLSGLRGLARHAASWGGGTHGARLSWDRPVPPPVYGLALPPLPEPAPAPSRELRLPVVRHRAPDDEPVPMRELPSTPTTAPPQRSSQRAERPRVLRLASCSPRARNWPAPSGWSPRRTGSPVPPAWRPSRPVATRSMPRSLRDSPCRSSNRTSTARGARSPSSSPGARGQPPVRGSPSSSPDKA